MYAKIALLLVFFYCTVNASNGARNFACRTLKQYNIIQYNKYNTASLPIADDYLRVYKHS